MGTCGHCGTIIISGGVRAHGRRYCGERCYEEGHLRELARGLPAEEVDDRTGEVHQGDCPVCGGPGPVDVHPAHYVWSALAFTRYSTHTRLSCRGCARRRQVGASLFCAVLGWWGIPFGLVLTPVQIMRNLLAAARGESEGPSRELRRAVALQMAAEGDEVAKRAPRKRRRAEEGEDEYEYDEATGRWRQRTG